MNAAITDVLPAELEGFLIAGINVNHTGGGSAPTVTWDGGAVRPATVGAATTLVVTPQQNLGGATGILVGQGVTVTLTLQVPSGLAPAWTYNNQTITNTATVDADNSLPATGNANIVVSISQTVDVAVAKVWDPTTAQLRPGAASTISLSARNTANVPLDSLVIQEPKAALDGAATLDASNAFRIVDFTSFQNVVAPAGATAVTTDAYVWDAATSTYVWEAGVPLTTPATPTLPAGVAPGDVAGIRLTYTGSIAVGATASFGVAATQRSTFRGTTNPLTAGTRVDNVMSGTATKEGLPPVSKDATASHSLIAVPVGASITKNIAPSNILAGLSATATLRGRNTQADATTMTISDRGYFVEDEITFGGFTPAPAAPSATAGATLTGEVTWVKFDATEATVPFTAGQIPALPVGWTNADVSGFDIAWTATSGAITSTTASVVVFKIDTAVDAVAANADRNTTNTASVAVSTPFGPASDTDTATLRVTGPSLAVGLTKTIRPGANAPVFVGDLVTATLTPTIQGNGAGLFPTRLSVTDTLAMGAGGANGGFWNVFDLYAIAPTTVNAGVTLSLKAQTPGGWVELGPFTGPTSASLNHTQLAAKVGGDTSLITGVDFTYTNASGLGLGGIQAPNLTFQARDQLRSGGPTAPVGGASTYVNVARAEGEGRIDVPNSPTLTDDADATANAAIQRADETGVGPCTNNCPGAAYGVNKRWQNQGGSLTTGLPAQSAARAWTRLQWRVGGVFADVTLQDHGGVTPDPSTPSQVSGTVYDAFNLIGVEAITNSGTIGANGWYLRWDKITAIQIWNGSAWTVPSQCGGTCVRQLRVGQHERRRRPDERILRQLPADSS